MIQIVRQRVFTEGKDPVFAFTEPRIFVPNLSTLFKRSHELLEALPKDEHWNLFYTLGHHAGAVEASRGEAVIKRPIRTAQTLEYQTVLPFDIDGADTARPLEYAAAIAGVLGTPVDGLTVLVSGNGVHVLVALKHPIHSAKYFTDNRDAYKEICAQAAAAMTLAGLPLSESGKKVDSSVFDPARVFRVPGSINRKPGKPDTECRLIQERETLFNIDLYEISGLKARAKENISPAELRRSYPVPDFARIATECAFIKWATEHPVEVHEPQAFDLFSLLAPQPQDAKVVLGAFEFTPKTLAEHVFKQATASSSLKQVDFETKWEQAKEYGGRKCSTIDAHWGECQTCPHYGKIATPLALKSAEHIASETLGYWVLGQKGQHLHPAYSDLEKVFRAEHPYVVSEGRILTYANGVYTPRDDFYVKAWLQGKVRPRDPLRECHRAEFVHGLRPEGFISEEAAILLFEESIRGRLSCANGILNIQTGKMEEPHLGIGFKTKLPYAVDLSAEPPEFFMDWLGKITQENSDLMECLLDAMAYCLWPSYDDHVFFYLTGEGANGKSTLIHLIETMVGLENRSTVGIHQLGTNRFAPAQLEGKLVNLSEESSGGGKELDSDALNTIKTLSSGGSLMVERKGKDGFMHTNTAKLIFSSNSSPRFQETGHSIERRIIAIPFKHRISDPDTRVEERLKLEVPQIVPLLIRRIQAKLAQDGQFKCHRGGAEAVLQKEEVLYGQNTSYQWAKENLEMGQRLGDDAYLVVDEAYKHYREWCEANGHRYYATKSGFGKALCAVLPVKESKVKKISGVACRIYTHAKFKEGIHP